MGEQPWREGGAAFTPSHTNFVAGGLGFTGAAEWGIAWPIGAIRRM